MNGKITTFEWRVDHFSLDQIAESGQTFRWRRRGPESYAIPAGDHYCVAYMTAPDRLAVRCREGLAAWWRYYFGLGDEYPEYWRAIETWAERDGPDAYLTRAAEAASGMVILHQPAWETMASYMVSQNNNIPRIKATVVSTMYDMSRIAAKGYFDEADSEEARHQARETYSAARTAIYRSGDYGRAGGRLYAPARAGGRPLLCEGLQRILQGPGLPSPLPELQRGLEHHRHHVLPEPAHPPVHQ